MVSLPTACSLWSYLESPRCQICLPTEKGGYSRILRVIWKEITDTENGKHIKGRERKGKDRMTMVHWFLLMSAIARKHCIA